MLSRFTRIIFIRIAPVLLMLGALFLTDRPTTPVNSAQATPYGDLMAGRTIILDPGHGGWDPGSIGHQSQEAKLNLEIALALRQWLQAAGAKVVMTWSKSSDIAPREKYRVKERVQFINSIPADILIDIHCNASSPDLHGPQTFYWSGTPSHQLALDVQEELQYMTGTRRQIQRINQYVLRYANIPAINVEVGFITNPQEERNLMNPAYQKKLTWAIFLGTERWFLKGKFPVEMLKSPQVDMLTR